MAAIIAQISRANLERKARRTKQISSDKSVSFIVPYDLKFDPEIHNKYVKSKKIRDERLRKEKLEFVRKLLDSEENILDDRKRQLKMTLVANRTTQKHDTRQISVACCDNKSPYLIALQALKCLSGFCLLSILCFVMFALLFTFLST